MMQREDDTVVCPLSEWLAQPTVRNDPHGLYAALREQAAVVPVELAGGVRTWLVTRYSEAMAVLRDDRFVRNVAHWPAWQRGEIPITADTMLANGLSMGTTDPPEHTRLRQALDRAFTMDRVERLRGWIESVSQRLIDECAMRYGVDLISEYAAPLSMAVICELFGTEPSDRAWLSAQAMALTDRPPYETGTVLEAVRSYLGELIEARRRLPRGDLTSALVGAPPEERLTEEELVELLLLLLVLGHDITTNLVGVSLALILSHPKQRSLLVKESWRAGDAVDEVVRYDSPLANTLWRYPLVDVEVGGVLIRTGEPVAVSIAAANRDPRHFVDPDTFDISAPARWHLAFGHGIHRCMAAPLARLTAQVTLWQVPQALSSYRLAVRPEELQYRPSTSFRGLAALPVYRAQSR
ncbi:cytochrome P450 [Streptomyces chartreusis]